MRLRVSQEPRELFSPWEYGRCRYPATARRALVTASAMKTPAPIKRTRAPEIPEFGIRDTFEAGIDSTSLGTASSMCQFSVSMRSMLFPLPAVLCFIFFLLFYPHSSSLLQVHCQLSVVTRKTLPLGGNLTTRTCL